MSEIGVDLHTYQLVYKQTYSECLHRQRGDAVEARKLAAYYMRDWYVIGDGRKDDKNRSLRLRRLSRSPNPPESS